MANTQSIESLSLQITATASNASRAIDNLTARLGVLNDALTGLDTSNLNKLNSAFSTVSSGAKNVSSATDVVAKSFSNFSSKALSLTGAIATLKSGFQALKSAVGTFNSIVTAASDLTEVENVVDRTFGDLSYKAEQLASTSITDFGMSELTAKKIASRYQAMGVSMGLTASQVQSATSTLSNFGVKIGNTGDSVADMSLNLTELAADLASFYNTDVDEAAEKLNAVFTGQTRPLREYGIDLTQATLKEWALKSGLDADVASMSQAEKTMLRYQYVLANTSFLHGDFKDTSQTWANQTKILTQQFEALRIVIGQGLIQAVKPFVQSLNTALSSVISFATSVLNALGKIFGWEVDVSTAGTTLDDSLSDAADSVADTASGASDTSSGLSDANKNAKDLAKTLLGIDELNLNAPDTGSSSSSGKGGSGSGGSGSSGSGSGSALASLSLKQTKSAFESGIDTLFGLGKYIGDTLANVMNNIDWDSIYAKAKNFGYGLAQYLNGTISPEHFASIGQTIAGALNTVFYAVESFASTFEWTGLGNSIAAGINKFFETFDFVGAASAVSKIAIGLLNTFLAAVKKTDWYAVGNSIGTFIAKIEWGTILKKAAQAAWEAFNGAIDALKGMFDATPFLTTFVSIAAIAKLTSGNVVKSLEKIGASAKTNGSLLNTLLGSIDAVWMGFQDAFSGKGIKNITAGFSTGLENIRGNLTNVQKGVLGVTGALTGLFGTSTSIKSLVTETGNLGTNIASLATSTAISASSFTLAFGVPAGLIATAITGVIGLIKGVAEAFEEIKAEQVGYALNNALSNPGGVAVESLFEQVTSGITNVKDSFTELSDAFSYDGSSSKIAGYSNEIGALEWAMQNGSISISDGARAIGDAFDNLSSEITSNLSTAELSVATYFGEDSSIYKYMQELGINIGEAANNLVAYNEKVSVAVSEANEKIQEYTKILEEGGTLTAEQQSDYESARSTLEKYTSAYNDLDSTYSSVLTSIRSQGSLIDWSSLYSDGTLDIDAFTGQIENMAEVYATSVEEIDQSTQEVIQSLQATKAQAEQDGDADAAQAAQTLIDSVTSYSEAKKEALKTEIQSLYSDLDTSVIEGIGTVAQNASDYWDEHEGELLGKWGTKGNYVKAATDEYNTNVIEPYKEALTKGFNGVGIEVGTAAEEAYQTIVSKLYGEEVDLGRSDPMGNYFPTNTTLVDNWAEQLTQAIDKYTATLPSDCADLGAAVQSGYAKGISDNQNLTNTAVSAGIEAGIEAAETAQDSHSPSKVYESLGNDAIDGYVLAFSKDTSAATAVKKWLTNVVKVFTSSTWKSAIEKWFNTSIKPYFSLSKWNQLTQPIKTSLTGTFNQVTAMWNSNSNNLWNSITQFFSYSRWYNAMGGIPSAFSNIFTSAGNTVVNIMNRVISAINSALNINWATLSVDGRMVVSSSRVRIGSMDMIGGFKYGGYPDKSSLFWAGEGGIPEMVGTVGGRTAVASGSEITGIKEAVNNQASAEQVLLNTCISLLQTIANKDSSITIDGRELVKAVNDRNKRNGYSFTG